MKSLDYLTCSQLPCVATSQAPIIICIKQNISLVSGGHTVPGFLITSLRVIDDCAESEYWRYTLAYDEALLTDPTTPLQSTDITGVFCETCFTDWIKELIAKMIAEAAGGGGYPNAY